MRYDRSVSAPSHGHGPETVWGIRMPAIRFGRGAVRELDYQLEALGVSPEATGLLVTDGTLRDLGHAGRVTDQLADALHNW